METIIKILLYFVLIAIASCSNQSGTYNALENVNELLRQDENDSATIVFNRIDPNSIQTDEETAYYNLLKTIIDYRNYADIPSDSAIAISVNYYRKTNNKYKLAVSQYYRGAILLDLDNYTDAIPALKEAEDLGEKFDDQILLGNIYRALTVLNCDAPQVELAIEYAHKQCNAMQKTTNQKWIAYAYLHLALIYSHIGQSSDSAKTYLDKCLLIADKIDSKDKAFVNNSIGEQLMETDTATAKLFFQKALTFNQFPESYLNLSKLYNKNGDSSTAKAYIDSALATAWPELKINILESIADEKLQSNDIHQYASAIQQIINLKDSINNADKERKTLEFQTKYDFDKQEAKNRERIIIMVTIIVLILMLSYLLHLRHKSKLETIENEKNKETTEKAILAQQNAELEMDLLSLQKKNADMSHIISVNKDKIKQLESEGSIRNTELQNLKAQMDKAQSIQQEIINKGLSVMQKIERNETKNWTQQDFSYAIIYYESQNPNVIYETELEYDNLTTFEKFFIILDKYLGKDDDQIAQILSISAVTVRTRRSKIKAKRIQK